MNRSFSAYCLIMMISFNYSQKGVIEINQNPLIDSIINLKKEVSKNMFNLKVQIYSGKRDKAIELIEFYENQESKIDIELVYETPNYKVWIGNYYSQLQADKELLTIKKKHPEAFIFRPKPKSEETAETKTEY